MSVTKAIAGLAAITIATAFIAGSLLSTARDRAEAADAGTAIRKLPVFDRVSLNGAFSTTVVSGTAQRVEITADRSLLERVTTSVHDGTLEIGVDDGPSIQSPIRLDIALANLRGFSNYGAGTTTISGVHDDVAIANHGAGSITASGHSPAATISLAGVGKIDTTGLDARDVTVDNDGVGSVHVRGSGNLTLSVNGVGEIRYTGKPQHVDKAINGIGRISAL